MFTTIINDIYDLTGVILQKFSFTLTESKGYITQCSSTPAIAPAVIWTAKFFVGSVSYSSKSIIINFEILNLHWIIIYTTDCVKKQRRLNSKF